ncbi:Bug family tripartite tricarboxylate transporter substrate binding protein [Paracraurococcus lichenis]|uniref:Tripartite tricarboxylate transporter substrate binding protein n=1 Tax=Paracraurococcus lichenis TaxID=3064888 RepID=A0ABT9E646_9PROT|nr:tripartite tricarboxylate transporter substrate binding protein [Paracraurococcus sp. LOR1-02]MDO9711651.1 tripartite tricarboxylate transporter substrate binding protein [Paracraurococcus sp. LOR1-02]
MSLARRSLLAAPLLLPAAGARAEAPWPERPLRLIVPFPPGSTPDTTGRAVAAHLSRTLGQPCLVENRAGAGGNIGTDAVAKATDGHTIGLTINGPLSTAKALYPDLPYDPQRDLAMVSLLVRAAQMLVVHPDVPAQDLAGFVAHVRANPGKLAFGSVGSGSGGHLAMADLMARAGLEMLHVPYRGFPPATLDLVAGRIQAMVIVSAGILPQIREGRVRALAVTAERRIPQAPEVPTLAEAGFPDAASYAWNALIAPAAMPAARVARLAEEAGRALAEPQARAALEAGGFEVVASGPAEATRFVAAETARWSGLIARLGITAEA